MKGEKTQQMEEYLEAMARLREKGREITVSALAKELKLSKASASEMLNRMADRGLVKYERYGKAELTKKGRESGEAVLRKHRLIEKFLRFLGLRGAEIHEEACILEHAISDEVEKHLRRKMRKPELMALTELGNRKSGIIARIDAGHKASQRLADMGLTKGARITVLKTAPFRGPLRVCIRETCLAVGRNIASRIFVEAD